MAQPTLEACREKHRRGVEHLNDLNTAVAQYLGRDPKPHRISGKFHPDRREYVVVGEILEPMDDLRWGVLLGDALHNLRSALDHLVWQLVLLNTGKDGGMGNKFPMEASGRRYWSITKDGKPSVRERSLKGVADEHRAIIDALQPYRTRELGKASYLVNLREWSNYDKHRLLNPALVALDAIGEERIHFSFTPDTGEIVGVKGSPFSPDGEAEVLVVEFSCPGKDLHVTMDHEPPIRIGFGKPPVRTGDLPKLGVYVGEVIEAFADSF